MKADKNFRMARTTKMSIATLPKGEKRSAFKNAMIQGQLAEEAAKRAALRSKDKNDNSRSSAPVVE